MKLPNLAAATVPERKVTLYLLSPAHPAGGSKAAFFLSFGFTITEWPRLVEALLRHAQENEVAATEETRHPLRRGWHDDRSRWHKLECPHRVVYRLEEQ